MKSAVTSLRTALGLAWRILSSILGAGAQVLLALLVLFEEWGWRPLSNALARLARFRLWARLENAVADLPPYAALATIALPTALLFPLKFVAIWLVANGHLVSAATLFVGAKVVSTALIARIFMLVRPALMKIGWFATLHDLFVPWKAAILARIRGSWAWRYGRMIKTAVRLEAKQAWAHWQPGLLDVTVAARAWAARQWKTARASARRLWANVVGARE